MITVQVSDAYACVTRYELLTSGMIGAVLHFEFAGDWAGLRKTAVFTNGKTTIDVLESRWTGNDCIIPHEVLAVPGVHLSVGVYGVDADGKLAIPTLYADCGIVRLGADPSGDTSTDPTLPVWEQLDKLSAKVDETKALVPQITTTISSDSTDTAAASAKAVYDAIYEAIGVIENGSY